MRQEASRAMGVKVKDPGPFKPLYTARQDSVDLILCIGGRGGKKTYEVSKFSAYDATIKNRRVAVVRDEKETIRESILNEIFQRFDSANQYGHFNGVFEKNQAGIRHMESGDMRVFTKGFRASSLEKQANLKGASDVSTVLIEEAEDIRDPTKFNTFTDSIRTNDRLIIVMLNTPDIQHWIVKRYFHLTPITCEDVPHLKHVTEKDLEGYWKLVPKTITGFRCIQTSFRDNEHLPDSIIRSYNNYGNPESETYDLHYYLTAICGFASSGRKGQIIKKAQPIKLADYLALPFKEIFAQDFGTAAPAGLVGVKLDGNNLYARTLNYKPMDTLSLAIKYCELQLDTENDLIIADSADPLAIAQLRNGWEEHEIGSELAEKYPQLLKGWTVYGVVKGPGSVEHGLGLLTSMRLHFVDDDYIIPNEGLTPLWYETYNYIYNQNKSGEYTNDPKDEFNHVIDPVRYVAQSRGRYF